MCVNKYTLAVFGEKVDTGPGCGLKLGRVVGIVAKVAG